MMFNKKEAPRDKDPVDCAQTTAAPKIPTVLERLRKKRADKMQLVKRLDREIAQLDHDITYVERYPHNARILEFICARFDEEPMAIWMDEKTEPWHPGREK